MYEGMYFISRKPGDLQYFQKAENSSERNW